ncbi:MAG: hypothetical protein ACJ70Z_00675 [Nitrososphaera sp.]
MGTVGFGDIYYDLRTEKQYVEVYYITHIREIEEILMQLEEVEENTLGSIYYY